MMNNDKQYNAEELANIIAVDSMKRNIKILGQKRTLEIINGNGLILTKQQRLIYKRLYFKALHKIEMED